MINLFQFWNTPTAPTEVEELLASWELDPNFNYRRFNTATAEQFIETHFDERTLKAFKKCKVPAMQADLFRYCALFSEGGIYVDADTKNSGKLLELLTERTHGLLMTREERIANDFMYVQDAEDQLFKETIIKAVANIENEISNNVWMVTGPGIMTHMNQDNFCSHLFRKFDFEPARVVREFVLFYHNLEYKASVEDWRQYSSDKSSSIFKCV